MKQFMKIDPVWREAVFDLKYLGKRLILGIVLQAMISYLFFQSVLAMLPLQLLWIPYWIICIKALKEDKEFRYLMQLRDFLQILSGNLQAGRSVEVGMKDCLDELEKEWGVNSFIYQDVFYVVRKIEISGQFKEAFKEWGRNRESQDLRLFITVFLYGKKTGANLCEIMKRTTDSISERARTKQEIHTLLASKRYEQSIMSLMPIAIMWYIQISNEGYLDPLYHNETGILVMSIALVIYLLAVVLGRRMLQIEVMK